MRFRRHLAEPDESIELNLIPLIDIIMFLLIFFISTTSFIEEPGVPVEKSRALTAKELDKNSIIFAVTAFGSSGPYAKYRANDHVVMARAGCFSRGDFAFRAGVTTLSTPISEVLKRREGVCQDFTHLMIGALRGLGLPARGDIAE